MQEEEQALLQRAKQGDQAAFGQLVARYEKQVYHQALRLLGQAEDAGDVTQEVFFKAWRGLPSFQGDSTLSTWLYRLTGNAAIDLLRREGKRRGEVSLDDEAGGWDNRLASPDDPPERALEREDLKRVVAWGLSRLSVEHRQVLVLREVNGASYEQIGQVLGLPPGTVKSRVARARLALARLLREAGYGP
ncbi:MAG TPA: sigma-70 family RNA polymerase sigma factor [Firmicutes bacterium]|nr:sigma-70 family RNA polymerase sigma factor [Bacillota bacterium]